MHTDKLCTRSHDANVRAYQSLYYSLTIEHLLMDIGLHDDWLCGSSVGSIQDSAVPYHEKLPAGCGKIYINVDCSLAVG